MFLNILLHGENYAQQQASRTPHSGKANDRSLSEDFKNLARESAPEGPPDTREAASLAYNNLNVPEAGKRSTTNQKMTRNIKINKSAELNDSSNNAATPSTGLAKPPQSVGQIPLSSMH